MKVRHALATAGNSKFAGSPPSEWPLRSRHSPPAPTVLAAGLHSRRESFTGRRVASGPGEPRGGANVPMSRRSPAFAAKRQARATRPRPMSAAHESAALQHTAPPQTRTLAVHRRRASQATAHAENPDQRRGSSFASWSASTRVSGGRFGAVGSSRVRTTSPSRMRSTRQLRTTEIPSSPPVCIVSPRPM